jgi:hypothetical protein
LGTVPPQPTSPTEAVVSPIPEDRAPSSALMSNVEIKVNIAAELMKSKERLNRAFAKHLHAKPTEQASASASALGNIPFIDQNTLLNLEDDNAATPEDDLPFDETVHRLIFMRVTFFTSDLFL